jgi:hypothetical protein
MTRPRPHFRAALAALLGLSLLAPAAAADDKPEKSPLEWAEELLDGVRPKDTSYRHEDPVVRWQGVDGAKKCECHTDCSGLLNALLAQAYGYTEDSFKDWLGHKRPTAKVYHDAVKDGNRFKRIERIRDVQPGDVLAIKYRPDDPENKGGDTGHVMLVAAKPEALKASKPHVEGTEQWEVAVIDECTSYHGKGDTRYREDGKGGGLGRGAFRIYADKDGKIVGHAWSTLAASEYHDQEDRHLTVGRFEP